MKWYKVYLNGENRIWKKCITYSWGFIHENEEIHFRKMINSFSTEEYKIQALVKGKGEIAKSISDFEKVRMPEFAEISHLFLIREDVSNIGDLSFVNGISLKKVSVEGDFPFNYMVLIFREVIDCVDSTHSQREEFDYLSTLVLDESKIPQSVDGFFLKGWNKYGFYDSIVNEKMKIQLLNLYKANEFLIFKEVQINNMLVTNG